MNAYPDSVALTRPDPALIQSAEQYLALACNSYASITTGDECEAAAEDLKSIKARQQALEEARTKITRPLLEAQRAVNALFKGPADMLAQAEQIVKRGILTYQAEEERKRREAEAAAAEAARKERAKLEAQAAKAAASGKLEKAEALQATAASIPERIEIASTAPRLGGAGPKTVEHVQSVDRMHEGRAPAATTATPSALRQAPPLKGAGPTARTGARRATRMRTSGANDWGVGWRQRTSRYLVEQEGRGVRQAVAGVLRLAGRRVRQRGAGAVAA
jgi:hypothetical protein